MPRTHAVVMSDSHGAPPIKGAPARQRAASISAGVNDRHEPAPEERDDGCPFSQRDGNRRNGRGAGHSRCAGRGQPHRRHRTERQRARNSGRRRDRLHRQDAHARADRAARASELSRPGQPACLQRHAAGRASSGDAQARPHLSRPGLHGLLQRRRHQATPRRGDAQRDQRRRPSRPAPACLLSAAHRHRRSRRPARASPRPRRRDVYAALRRPDRIPPRGARGLPRRRRHHQGEPVGRHLDAGGALGPHGDGG